MVEKKPSLSLTSKHGNSTNRSVSARNLEPEDLGAVIFGCTNNTFAECHARQLFGLPKGHLSYVKNIKEGLPLFLFNYNDRTLHGIYEAVSNGMFCPQSNAWSTNGKEKTSYPAQVAMRVKLWCFPLAERQFRNAILTNYQMMSGVPGKMHHFFHFELDHTQTHALMSMFTPLPFPYNFGTPNITTPVCEHVRKSTSPPVYAPEGNSDVASEKALKPHADVAQKEIIDEVGYIGVSSELATSYCERPSGFNDVDCGDAPFDGDCALSNKDAEVQQLQSGQLDKKLSLELEKLKTLSPQQHSSEFCANAPGTADIGTYSCKDVQEVKSTILGGPSNLPKKFDAEIDHLSSGHSNPPVCTILDGPSNLPKKFDAEIDHPSSGRSNPLVQSLDLKSHTKAKMMNTGCTAVNELSPSLPAITKCFQETETQLTQTVHETPNSNNDSGAPQATDPAGHPKSCCAESTIIRPLTILSSQERMRDKKSQRKGRKRKTATQAIQEGPNGHDDIHNMHPTELPSPDYISWYVKDRLNGKITCMVCGEEGHYTCHCPTKDQGNKVVCTLCNKVGHCYLWCCRLHVSENRACRRCGEKGHYTNKDLSHYDERYTSMSMYVRCSVCDDNHALGRCPMRKVTCFLCEGKDHVPAHCRLSPMLTVTQYYQEGFRAILKQALTETSRSTVTPAKLSSELEPHDDNHERQFKRTGKLAPTNSSLFFCAQGDCERKNSTGTVLDSNETNHSALTEKALTPRSSFACFNCHEEGHHAHRCPKKKRPGEQELSDVTCYRFRGKKRKVGLNQCDVTCFYCQDKGHYSYSCPMNTQPGGFELKDVTFTNFKANRCDGKPPGELLCDVTCFKCHDKGHKSYNCPKNKPPGQCHSERNAKRRTEKKRKKDQQK